MRLKVRIRNVLYPYRKVYANYMVIPEYNDYEGEIVPSPSWLSKNQFMMTTGDPDAPYRILEKDSIICGWRISSVDKCEDQVVVRVPGKSGTVHLVSLDSDGVQLRCDCLGFSYRKTCSHVKAVERAMELV